MRGREHQMALSAWGMDYSTRIPMPMSSTSTRTMATTPKSKPFLWRSRFKNDYFAAKAEAARDEKDPAKRIELYEALQREHMENSPFVFMFQTTKTAAFRKGVSGFELAFSPRAIPTTMLRKRNIEQARQKHIVDTEQRHSDAVRFDAITFLIGRVMPVDPVISRQLATTRLKTSLCGFGPKWAWTSH